MSLLDSDAEELKNRGSQTPTTTTGRKTNQSGLGAFKSLSKYSSLTSKYRTTGKEPSRENASPTPPPVTDSPAVQLKEPVEQFRGTIETPAQKVSAKSVQSESITAPTYAPTLSETKSVQHIGKESAVLHPLSESAFAAAPTLQNDMVEEKSTLFDDKKLESKFSDAPTLINVGTSINISENNALGSQCKDAPNSNETKNEKGNRLGFDLKQSSKGSQKCIDAPTSDDLNKSATESPEVSANSSTNVGATPHQEYPVKVSAKSVQTEFVAAPTLESQKNITDQILEQIPSAPLTPVGDEGANQESRSSISKLSHESHRRPENISNLKVGAKVSAKWVQKSVQIKPELGAESVQKSVQSQCEVGSKVSAKIRPLEETILQPMVSILTLNGSQRILLEFIFDQFNNSLITPPITKEQLLSVTGLKEETALSAIKRLRKKHLIDRAEYKDGKAGWTKYELAEITYKEILNFRNSKSPFATELNFSAHLQNPKVGSKVSAIVSANAPSKIDSKYLLSILCTYFSCTDFKSN